MYEEVKMWADLSTQQGINTCIFAYGQSGTGKTFTMLGDGVDMDTVRGLPCVRSFAPCLRGFGRRAGQKAAHLACFRDPCLPVLLRLCCGC